MRTSEKTDLIIPALLKARSHMQPAEKDKENKHFNYSYATEQSWHDNVMPYLLDQDLLLSFSVTAVGRVGNLTTVQGCARVTHSSGQWIEVDAVGEGQDNADKAAFKAQTGLKKYLYAMCFALPTTDDVEDDRHDVAAAKRTTFRAAKEAPPAKDQGQVNAERVSVGLEPVHSLEDKTAAIASYQQLRKLGATARATAIKAEAGTDYAKMKNLLDLAIREILEGAPK